MFLNEIRGENILKWLLGFFKSKQWDRCKG